MVDGFVQQYKDGGWISRWSSPGYADLMTGTSSDVAFADAYVKGVGFDAEAAYEAAREERDRRRRPQPGVGPQGHGAPRRSSATRSTDDARGHVVGAGGLPQRLRHREHGRRRCHEKTGRAPALQGGVGVLPQPGPELRQPLRPGNAGFFQGRDADGDWRSPPGEYDPRVWGYDYTETNGWNFAFTAPQDGQGLANLYGGRDGLAEKLDAFFATPGDGARSSPARTAASSTR